MSLTELVRREPDTAPEFERPGLAARLSCALQAQRAQVQRAFGRAKDWFKFVNTRKEGRS